MNRPRYNLPTAERTFSHAIAVTASDEDTFYPASNLLSEDPADVAKLTTDTGSFVFEFAEKVAAAFAGLINQYLDAGLTGVKIQGNDTDSWGTPAFSQTIEIPAKRLDGPSFQPWTNNIGVLLDALPDPDGYLFWRIVFEDANSQPIALGRLWLSESLASVDLFHHGQLRETDDLDNVIHETELLVRLVEDLGGPVRTVAGVFIGTDLSAGTAPHQLAADFRQLKQASNDGMHPLLFIPFPERDLEPLVGYFVELTIVHEQGGYQVWTFTFRESSRGIPWP